MLSPQQIRRVTALRDRFPAAATDEAVYDELELEVLDLADQLDVDGDDIDEFFELGGLAR